MCAEIAGRNEQCPSSILNWAPRQAKGATGAALAISTAFARKNGAGHSHLLFQLRGSPLRDIPIVSSDGGGLAAGCVGESAEIGRSSSTANRITVISCCWLAMITLARRRSSSL